MPERTMSLSERVLGPAELSGAVAELLRDGWQLALGAAHDDGDSLRVVYVLLHTAPDRRTELTVRVPTHDPRLPSLAGVSYAAGRFEREMHDLFGLIPVDHPLPRRLVRHAHWPAGWYPLRRDAGPSPGFAAGEAFPFLTVQGRGVYEIPVGPIHAGLIEPGHFRFSVVGETILRLKARLWYVHRGVEKLFEQRAALDGTPLAERISGDTSVGHALAYCLAVEDAWGLAVPAEGQRLRALLLELERMYNHVADLGALANDVGYGIANAHALRIRERLLRLNARVTGHRLLREAIRPGGVSVQGLPSAAEVEDIAAEVAELVDLTLAHSVVHERFEGTAVLPTELAAELGCLGYVARASGLVGDARVDHPFVELPVTPVVRETCDVLARYQVRAAELAASARLVVTLLGEAGPFSVVAANRRRRAGHGVGVVEGWRGRIVHRVEIDAAGRLTRVKVVDPSWFNWPAVPLALRDTIVPDFPVTNKSFNLSYAGNDL
jgi:Ni,Fe-hydrogenase III large subunit/Ni,Fe-hydrogenase III component G